MADLADEDRTVALALAKRGRAATFAEVPPYRIIGPTLIGVRVQPMRKFDANQVEIAASDQHVAPDPVSLHVQSAAKYIIHITPRPRRDFDFQHFIDIRAR
eukprot:3149127-Pyramimonas_sp.AAC.1